MFSIAARLLLSASVVLVAFLGLTGYALDQAFQESRRESVRAQLQAHTYMLVAAAELQDAMTIKMPPFLLEPRFDQQYSGLYARITGFRQKVLWKSSSFSEQNIPLIAGLQPSEDAFLLVYDEQGRSFFLYALGVAWDELRQLTYVFNVIEDVSVYAEEVVGFRQRLGLWLGGVAIVLLFVQWLVLRWGLQPLRCAAVEIQHIEVGEQADIHGRYPREIATLTQNINRLLQSNRNQLSRYRHALGDLAHSLKTPLALLQGIVEAKTNVSSWRSAVSEQVDRMKYITDYQLQRAATSGRQPLSEAVALQKQAHKIRRSLDKVYRDRNIICEIDIPADMPFFGDDGDLLELLGNVMDNAYIWCHRQVRVSAQHHYNKLNVAKLHLCIEDDGPGISETLRDQVIERGIRAQEGQGSGIGLSIVYDIVQAYQGWITIEKSAHLGGAAVMMQFPLVAVAL